jgi:hypothetical protein
MAEHAHEHDRDRLVEVQDFAGLGNDQIRIVIVRVDVRCHALGSRVDQQHPRVRQHDRIVVDVHDPRLRRDRLGDLVGVLHGGQAGADVEELANPGFPGQEPHDANEKLSRLLGHSDHVEELQRGVTGVPVGLVVVLTSHPVVPDAGRTRHVEVDPTVGFLLVPHIHHVKLPSRRSSRPEAARIVTDPTCVAEAYFGRSSALVCALVRSRRPLALHDGSRGRRGAPATGDGRVNLACTPDPA